MLFRIPALSSARYNVWKQKDVALRRPGLDLECFCDGIAHLKKLTNELLGRLTEKLRKIFPESHEVHVCQTRPFPLLPPDTSEVAKDGHGWRNSFL